MKRIKPQNGQGQSGQIILSFDLSDPDQARAYDMAQQLASPHGMRKHVFVGFLLFLESYQAQTGIRLTADRVMGLYLTWLSQLTGSVAFSAAQSNYDLSDAVAGSSDRTDAAERNANYLSGMAGLLSEDDDLW